MTIDEQIAVLQAVKEGRKIEVSADDGQTWHPKDGHKFNFGVCLYRIVREPRRFIIYTRLNGLHVVPYGKHVPDGCKIICTAVEEENIGAAALAKLGTEIAE